MRSLFVLLLFAFTLRAAEPGPDSKPLLTILFTAEAHAALLPCDCPLQPLGGVARRATLIERCRARGPVLLLDAGGWASGGLYDEDSDGDPKRDALRTKLMADAMRLMKYDAVLLGATEAAALKSENEVPAKIANGTIETEAAGKKLEIYGWSEPEVEIFGRKTGPLPKQWNLPGKQFYDALRVHLSRFGEEDAETLEKLTGADLVINAGRKNSARTDWRAHDSQFVNFDYQARSLGVIEVRKNAAGAFDFRVKFEPLTPDIPDHPAVAALLAPHLAALQKKGRKQIDIEYWTMPECPGCKLVRPDLDKLHTELAGRVSIVPHFVVEKQNGQLASMHGEAELAEAKIQALVIKYYPEKIWGWLDWRAKNKTAPWESGVAALGLLMPRLQMALNAGEADKLLEADFELAERRHVRATPSLIIANKPYDGDIDRAHLLGALCGMLESPKPDACKDAPACFFDSQCRKRGYIAKCVEPGKPTAHCDTTQPAVKVPATILVDKDALSSNHERILEAIIHDLPGVEFNILDIAEPRAALLANKIKIARLPAYLLDPIAKTESGYKESLGRVARDVSFANEQGAPTSYLLLREDRNGVGANRFLARPRIKGRADLFVSRFSKNGQEALENALEFAKLPEAAGLTLELHDTIFWKNNDDKKPPELAAPNGLAELEEAARAMAVRLSAPEKLNAYLLERGKKRGSSYWDEPLRKAGLDADKIHVQTDPPTREIMQALEADSTLLKSLDTGGEIILLAENCELVPVPSRKDLRQILERIAGRGVRQK